MCVSHASIEGKTNYHRRLNERLNIELNVGSNDDNMRRNHRNINNQKPYIVSHSQSLGDENYQ